MVGGQPHPVEIPLPADNATEIRRGVPGWLCRVEAPEPLVEVVDHEVDFTGEAMQVHVIGCLYLAVRESVCQQLLDTIIWMRLKNESLPTVAKRWPRQSHRRGSLGSFLVLPFNDRTVYLQKLIHHLVKQLHLGTTGSDCRDRVVPAGYEEEKQVAVGSARSRPEHADWAKVEPVSHREGLRSGVKQDSGPGRSKGGLVERVAQPSDMVELAAGIGLRLEVVSFGGPSPTPVRIRRGCRD